MYKGVYVHVPFCRKACSYCNFYFETPSSLQKKIKISEVTSANNAANNSVNNAANNSVKPGAFSGAAVMASVTHASKSKKQETQLLTQAVQNNFTAAVIKEALAQKTFFADFARSNNSSGDGGLANASRNTDANGSSNTDANGSRNTDGGLKNNGKSLPLRPIAGVSSQVFPPSFSSSFPSSFPQHSPKTFPKTSPKTFPKTLCETSPSPSSSSSPFPFAADERGSIYFGGGTPSVLTAENLSAIITQIKETFFLSETFLPSNSLASEKQKATDVVFSSWASSKKNSMAHPLEISIEVNPEDVTKQSADAWQEAGINRVSLGVQSSSLAALHYLGRAGDYEQSLKALGILTKMPFRISVDLIIGHASSSESDMLSAIEQINTFGVEHFSLYLLELVRGTPLYKQVATGKKNSSDERVMISHYKAAHKKLTQLGFVHYEISSYAKNGAYARHNASYWFHHPYLGLGPGAESFNGINMRKKNISDVLAYNNFWLEQKKIVATKKLMSDAEKGEQVIFTKEVLDAKQLQNEYIMLRLRSVWGISLAHFAACFGSSALQQFCRTAALLQKSALLQCYVAGPAENLEQKINEDLNNNYSGHSSKNDSLLTVNLSAIIGQLPSSLLISGVIVLTLEGRLVADAAAQEFFAQ